MRGSLIYFASLAFWLRVFKAFCGLRPTHVGHSKDKSGNEDTILFDLGPTFFPDKISEHNPNPLFVDLNPHRKTLEAVGWTYHVTVGIYRGKSSLFVLYLYALLYFKTKSQTLP